MKSILVLIVLTFLIISCSKPEPILGCMEQNALNYDELAEEDDGNCTFKGYAVIWYNINTFLSISLLNVTFPLKVYVDGDYVGTLTESNVSPNAPACLESGGGLSVMQIDKIWREYQMRKSYDFKVEDSNRLLLWEGTLELEANKCKSLELTV